MNGECCSLGDTKIIVFHRTVKVTLLLFNKKVGRVL